MLLEPDTARDSTGAPRARTLLWQSHALSVRWGGLDRESRTDMYETTSPSDTDEAVRALQTALDRRDNGGPTGH